jgi:hypothetical protein
MFLRIVSKLLPDEAAQYSSQLRSENIKRRILMAAEACRGDSTLPSSEFKLEAKLETSVNQVAS